MTQGVGRSQRPVRSLAAGGGSGTRIALRAAAAIAIALLAGCHRADDDYQACARSAYEAGHEPQTDAIDMREIRKCMAAKGWRQLRPSLPPGSNSWARVAP